MLRMSFARAAVFLMCTEYVCGAVMQIMWDILGKPQLKFVSKPLETCQEEVRWWRMYYHVETRGGIIADVIFFSFCLRLKKSSTRKKPQLYADNVDLKNVLKNKPRQKPHVYVTSRLYFCIHVRACVPQSFKIIQQIRLKINVPSMML